MSTNPNKPTLTVTFRLDKSDLDVESASGSFVYEGPIDMLIPQQNVFLLTPKAESDYPGSPRILTRLSDNVVAEPSADQVDCTISGKIDVTELRGLEKCEVSIQALIVTRDKCKSLVATTYWIKSENKAVDLGRFQEPFYSKLKKEA